MDPEKQCHRGDNTEQEAVLQRLESDQPFLPEPWLLHLANGNVHRGSNTDDSCGTHDRSPAQWS